MSNRCGAAALAWACSPGHSEPVMSSPASKRRPLNIYYLCHYIPNVAQTHLDYVEGLLRFSENNIRYLEVARDSKFHDFILPDLESFDVILLHHNLNLYSARLPPAIARQIREFNGLRVYFAQDEYTVPETTAQQLASLGIHAVFGCAGTNWRDYYPPKILPDLDYVECLPGYAPVDPHLPSLRPLAERALDIAYRGSHLGHFYGRLGFEKYEIGYHVKRLAQAAGLKTDIEWDRSKQIYGSNWLPFLASARTTLITESGSSLIHRTTTQANELHKTKELMLQSSSPEEYLAKLAPFAPLLAEDGQSVIATASQKVFEAALCGTVMIGFEGAYGNVLSPGRHYLPLKKDWSNANEILDAVRDIPLLEKLAADTRRDVLDSGHYSYAAFARHVDDSLRTWMARRGLEAKNALVPTRYFDRPRDFGVPPEADATRRQVLSLDLAVLAILIARKVANFVVNRLLHPLLPDRLRMPLNSVGLKFLHFAFLTFGRFEDETVARTVFRNQRRRIRSDMFIFLSLLGPALKERFRTRDRSAKPRFFLGLNECTGNIGKIQRLLRRSGYDVRSKSIRYAVYSQYEYDEDVDPTKYYLPIAFNNAACLEISAEEFAAHQDRKKKDLAWILRERDAIILNTSVSFLAGCMEYVLFRLAGKKLVVIHCGDDVRYRPIANQLYTHVCKVPVGTFSPLPNSHQIGFLLRRLWVQKMAEWFAQTLFTTFEQATFLARPSHQFQIPIDPISPEFRPTPAKVRILHAPSDPQVKRTDLVLAAIETLRARGLDFEFTLLKDAPNEKVLEQLKQTDLVIDQPNILFGVLLREAMSAGAVVAGIPDFTAQEHLQSSPVVPFTTEPGQLATVLEPLLREPTRIDELKRRSLAYYREHFSPEAFERYFFGAINGDIEPEVKPLADQKKLCLRFAESFFRRVAIRALM